MALLPNDTPKRTRVTLLGVEPRGVAGAGNAPSKGSGGDVALIVRVPSTQSVPCLSVRSQPVNGAATDLFDVDQAGNISALSGVGSLTWQQAQLALTAAQLKAMYAAPVQILAAPGAGLAIVVQEILFELTTTATAFANGGIVGFQYDSTANLAGTLVHGGSIPAAVITAGAGTTVTGLWAAPGANGLTIPANKGLFISNQTAAFITGTGTAKVWISYGLLTL